MERDKFTLMTLETAIKVAVERGIIEAMPSLEIAGAHTIRLTDKGKQVNDALRRG